MNAMKSTLTGLCLAAALSAPVRAQEPVVETAPAAPQPAPKLGQAGPNTKSFVGGGLGFIFTSIPISTSKFTVPMSELHYGYYFSDPNENLRTAITLGLYGFAIAMPFPKLGTELIIGHPTQTVQGKLGVSGFYDVAVGGHAGVAGEVGVRLKNRVDFSFFVVPAGTDSKRDYLEFMGMRTKTEDENGYKDGDGIPDYQERPHVALPYYGVFLTFNY